MYLIVFAVLFFVVSLVFSMFGLGGGLVYVPLLFLSGFPVKTASILSLFAITLTSLTAFLTFLRSGRFDWKLAAVIDPPTDVMAFVGGYYANLLDENVLRVVLVVVILVAGLLMVKQPKSFRGFKGGRFTWERRFKDEVYTVNVPLVGLMTGLVGFFVGMVGVTGGVFKVPIMVLLCGVPMDIAVGTSSGMVFLTAIFGLAGHLTTAENYSFPFLVLIGLVCLVGGVLGAKFSLRVGRERLRVFYGILMFILAVWVTLKSLF